MSANNEQTAPNNAPTLCKSGCGFFGSAITGGCCSKCWMAGIKNKKQTPSAPATADVVDVADNSKKIIASASKTSDQRRAATETEKTLQAMVKLQKHSAADDASQTRQLKKKKKKKTGYKNMMATMMAGTDKKDMAMEQDILAKGLGGGNFSKIEKI
jgi:sulfite reductase alpha subunit-like flavoprotein